MAALLLLLLTAAVPSSPLGRMQAWVGQGAGVAGYDATADCVGPRGEYQTRIAFRRSDGWARFTQWRDEVQIWDSVALGEDSWVSGDAGHWTEGDTDLQARILGHHFLAMILAPDRVFPQLGPARKGRLDDEPVVWVSGRDVAGHPVELALLSTGRPVAARITWGGAVGTLTLRFSGWERIGPVQLPLSVRIEQGKDVFRFRFRAPRLEAPDDAGWRPAGAGG
ncbi:MAG TPA: hypothetical protein VLT82_20020 [Myxococcaceae bacterium]|nr:hypothetical protein [Myxococcaceae bacterium]